MIISRPINHHHRHHLEVVVLLLLESTGSNNDDNDDGDNDFIFCLLHRLLCLDCSKDELWKDLKNITLKSTKKTSFLQQVKATSRHTCIYLIWPWIYLTGFSKRCSRKFGLFSPLWRVSAFFSFTNCLFSLSPLSLSFPLRFDIFERYVLANPARYS